MKVLVAGATGALGRMLVPKLVERGHHVAGMTRSEAKRDLVRGLGAQPVVADALDPRAVTQAVAEAEQAGLAAKPSEPVGEPGRRSEAIASAA